MREMFGFKNKKNNRSGISENSCAALLAHSKQRFSARPSPHAYLISSTLSATSIHIDERKRTRYESRYVASKKKKKITICSAVKEERSRTKAAKFKRGAYSQQLGGKTQKKKKNGNWTTEASYVDKKPDRGAMYCCWCDQVLSC